MKTEDSEWMFARFLPSQSKQPNTGMTSTGRTTLSRWAETGSVCCSPPMAPEKQLSRRRQKKGEVRDGNSSSN